MREPSDQAPRPHPGPGDEAPRAPARSGARRRRWRHSLYGRAALFLVLGSACLVGAVAKLSSTVADDSVKRLLGERIRLARTVGTYFENRLKADIGRLTTAILPLIDGDSPPDPKEIVGVLDHHSLATSFTEGAALLDPDAHIIAAAPDGVRKIEDSFDLPRLIALARARDGAVASALRYIGLKPVVLLVAPIDSRGRRLGYLAGLLQPAATDVLEAFRRADESSTTEFRVIDKHGTVVASTDRRSLYRRGDHGDVLADAIANHRELQGRCHTCHEEGQERKTDVLAFAPLPTLALGLAVHQPEKEVLTPAFALRKRMFFLGFVYITLFVLFAWLSVRAVVLPVRKLTAAVKQSEATAARPPPYPKDEVGDLARAMWRWRERMLKSLSEAEQSRQALHDEITATQRHLIVLQEIAAMSTAAPGLDEIVERGLDEALVSLELSVGMLCLRYRTREFTATRSLERDNLKHVDEDLCFAAHCSDEVVDQAVLRVIDLSDREISLGGRLMKTLVLATVRSPQGIHINVLLGDPEVERAVEERWLDSLLRHIRMSASNLLLREANQEREHQQRQYLHRVLKAQEDERRRVARDLHDTLAQDLAALRLDIERLTSRAEDDELREELRDLDQRAQANLVAVRRILLDLRLSVLDSMGFVPALQWYLERFERDAGVRGTLVVDGDESIVLAYETAVTLFRIAQESLQNAVQHGDAEHIFVTVAYTEDTVELIIEDDGFGFDPEGLREARPLDQERGLGILGMEERARLLGGEFRVESSIGEGAMVSVSVPLVVATSEESAAFESLEVEP